jgi:hypothetical protein
MDSESELRFTACLDARQQLANDLAIAIERGDVSQMSCGFIVAQDEWDENMEDRTIRRFADLLDVSAVTYPASPTTSIEVARRMALQVPVASMERPRKVYAALRAGKVLSQSNADRLMAAHESISAVLEAAGVGAQPEADADDAPTTVETPDAPDVPEADGNIVRHAAEGETTVGDDLGMADGTIGGHATSEGGVPGGYGDGTGIRSENVVDLDKVSRARALRIQAEARKRRRA